MSQEELERDAAIRVAGRPLVRPNVHEPNTAIRTATARLAEMRRAAKLQEAAGNDNKSPTDVAG